MTEIAIKENKINHGNSNSFSSIIILIISLSFAILIGSGFYGYGHDFYYSYNKHNLDWGGIFNRLGWILSTFSINGVHLGVQIVTFILSLSSGFLLREHIKFKQSYSFIFFIILYIVAIHTWPIIMSTSNAMRQGLSMSFIFATFITLSRRKYYWMLLYALLAVLTHKSGLVLAAIAIFSSAIHRFLFEFSPSSKKIIHFCIGIFLLFTAYLFFRISGLEEVNNPSKIIGGDFRLAFLFIGVIYISLSFFFKSILANAFNLSLYYFSFIAPSLLINGLNWEYERLGMMMLIPYILSFGVLLNRNSYKLYLLITFFLLLLLTFLTGMYASFR